MTLAPLLAAPPLVLVHVAATLVTLAAGTAVLAMAKGTPRHKMAGRFFATAMMLAALTSFGIWSAKTGHYSFIHILSLVTLVNIPVAIWQLRRGRIRGHAIGMIAAFASLIGAGAYAMLPSRLLGQMFFG